MKEISSLGVIWEALRVFCFSLYMSWVSWGRDNRLAVDMALSFYYLLVFVSQHDLFFGFAVCHWLTEVLWVSPNFRNIMSQNTWNFSHPASRKTPWPSEKREGGGSLGGLGRRRGRMGGWWNWEADTQSSPPFIFSLIFLPFFLCISLLPSFLFLFFSPGYVL